MNEYLLAPSGELLTEIDKQQHNLSQVAASITPDTPDAALALTGRRGRP